MNNPENPKILAVVPARGGSKRIPGKNIKLVNGKPLIAYTIEVASKSKYINKLILSTDSDEIIKVCKDYPIEIPFKRPANLATDNALAMDTYEHVILEMRNNFNFDADILVILEPTCPLRTTEDIDNAIKLFLEKKADSVRSMVEASPAEYLKVIDENSKISNYLENVKVLNMQDYKKVYIPQGAVTVVDAKLFLKHKKYYYENTYAHIMPKERSVDVDSEFEFKLAEYLFKKRFIKK